MPHFITLFQESFFQRALMGALLLSFPLALMGCFLLWRRLAFMGDTLGHGTVLGVSLGVLLGLNPTLMILPTAFLVAMLLWLRPQKNNFSLDTWMSMVSYGCLSLGLVILSFFPGAVVDPHSLLFGDILSLSLEDLYWIGGGGGLTLFLGVYFWRPWILIGLNEDLCAAEGVPVRFLQFVFMLTIAVVMAIGIKALGALLLPALMIIPVAAAVPFGKSPLGMVLASMICVLLSFILGLGGAFIYDTPTGPTIVVASLSLFFTGRILQRLLNARTTRIGLGVKPPLG